MSELLTSPQPLAASIRKTLPKVKRQKVRISLDVSPELNVKLDELSLKIQGSRSDVLRRALVLMDVAVRARDEGHKLGVVDKNQPLLTEIVGI